MIFLRNGIVQVFPHVFNALAQREGRKTTLPTLASLTGFTETQVQAAIATARRTHEAYARQIEVVKVGREWRFVASPEESINYPSTDDVVKAVEMGSQHIWKRVLAALNTRAGTVVSKEQLAKLASTPDSEITPQQAANAMMTILRQPIIGQQIEVVVAGRNWRYRSPSVSAESKPKEKQSTSSSIRGSVYRFMTNNPGKVLLADDIGEALGFTVKQVQNAMYDIANHNRDFTTVQRGNSWQYDPADAVPTTQKVATNGHAPAPLSQAPTQSYTPEAATTTLPLSSKVPSIPPAGTTAGGRLFEELGQLNEGALLLKEAETGTFYRATPLA